MAAALAVLVLLSYKMAPFTPNRSVTPGDVAPPPAPAAGFERGAVNVPVTVLWTEPRRLRDYDALMISRNNDPAAWAGGMDAAMRFGLVGNVETMALYGEPVVILERRGDWVKVAAEAQKTTLSQYGYPGWVPAVHIAINDVYLRELKQLPSVTVSKKTAPFYADQGLGAVSGRLSYQTKLPLLQEGGRVVAVRLPSGNTGYLARSDVKKTAELTFSGEGIVSEAKQFLGLPYIWGGTSPYGFDCSGFTMRLYQSQGITIPRDADEQAREGTAVARQDLRPGDLLFFAAKGGRGQIHHVGMYIDNGLMIHSPASDSSVRIEAFDGGSYGGEYWGARRYFPQG